MFTPSKSRLIKRQKLFVDLNNLFDCDNDRDYCICSHIACAFVDRKLPFSSHCKASSLCCCLTACTDLNFLHSRNHFLGREICLCKYLYLLIFYSCQWLGISHIYIAYTQQQCWTNEEACYLPSVSAPKNQTYGESNNSTRSRAVCAVHFQNAIKQKSCIKQPQNLRWNASIEINKLNIWWNLLHTHTISRATALIITTFLCASKTFIRKRERFFFGVWVMRDDFLNRFIPPEGSNKEARKKEISYPRHRETILSRCQPGMNEDWQSGQAKRLVLLIFHTSMQFSTTFGWHFDIFSVRLAFWQSSLCVWTV